MGILPDRRVWKRIVILAGALLLLLSAAVYAQPRIDRKSLTIRFVPVLAEETAGEGSADRNTVLSPAVTFRRAYIAVPENE